MSRTWSLCSRRWALRIQDLLHLRRIFWLSLPAASVSKSLTDMVVIAAQVAVVAASAVGDRGQEPAVIVLGVSVRNEINQKNLCAGAGSREANYRLAYDYLCEP